MTHRVSQIYNYLILNDFKKIFNNRMYLSELVTHGINWLHIGTRSVEEIHVERKDSSVVAGLVRFGFACIELRVRQSCAGGRFPPAIIGHSKIGRASSSRATNAAGFKLAPPTKAPSTFAPASSESTFSGVTLPP